MAQPTNAEMETAWRALSGVSTDDGWRSIPISGNGFGLIRAGRRFPGNEEAMLVSFGALALPHLNSFPEGKGFKIEKVTLNDSNQWLALVRQRCGSLDLFSRMVMDIVSTLAANSEHSPNRQCQIFMGRIKAWQDFMKKGHEGLSAEAELGLVGELDFLNTLLDQGLPHYLVIDAWKGPFDGLQDFELGNGAVEIKSTLSSAGFIASIMSLEQLDDSIRQPLFLCGRRFSIRANGLTLSQRIKSIRQKLSIDESVLFTFNNALLHAGYIDEHAENYIRCFTNQEEVIFHVDDFFPRLTIGNIPLGIRHAKYEIDLDSIASRKYSIEEILKLIGII